MGWGWWESIASFLVWIALIPLPLPQGDADVPLGMENLLTAPLVKKEGADLVCGSLVQGRGLSFQGACRG